MSDLLGLVMAERVRQDEKWGEQNHCDLHWLAILAEEVGELAAELIDDNPLPQLVRAELVQVAAVAVAWLECVGRRAKEVADE